MLLDSLDKFKNLTHSISKTTYQTNDFIWFISFLQQLDDVTIEIETCENLRDVQNSSGGNDPWELNTTFKQFYMYSRVDWRANIVLLIE
jgi:hypothetical protein